MCSFSMKLERAYRDNYYHNSTHATDMLQVRLTSWIGSSLFHYEGTHPVDTRAIVCLNICDLYGRSMSWHWSSVSWVYLRGHNNNLEIRMRSPLAIRYNDLSPLENYHAASSFALLHEEGSSLLDGFSDSDFTTFRSLFITLILATDNNQHF